MAADPLGLVPQGVADTGAAVVFGRSPEVANATNMLYKEAEQQKKKNEAQEKAKQTPFKVPNENGWYPYQAKLNEGYSALVESLTQKKAQGINIDTDPDALQAMQQYMATVGATNTKKKEIDDLLDYTRKNQDKIENADELYAYINNAMTGKVPLKDLISTPAPTPVLKAEEVDVDLTKPLGAINIGYIDETTFDTKSATGGLIPGQKTKKANVEGIYTQAKSIPSLYPTQYKEGIKRGLWENEDGMAEYYATMKINSADNFSQELFKNVPKDGTVGGSGLTPEQFDENFELWWNDFKSGQKIASDFLIGSPILSQPNSTISGSEAYSWDELYSNLSQAAKNKISSKFPGVDIDENKFSNVMTVADMDAIVKQVGNAVGIPTYVVEFLDASVKNGNGDMKLSEMPVYKMETVTPYKIAGIEKEGKTSKTKYEQGTSVISPSILTREEALKLYTVTANKRKMGYKPTDVGVSKSGKTQGRYGSASQKYATKESIKSLVGQPGYEGYTEQELIEYYRSQGYTIE